MCWRLSHQGCVHRRPNPEAGAEAHQHRDAARGHRRSVPWSEARQRGCLPQESQRLHQARHPGWHRHASLRRKFYMHTLTCAIRQQQPCLSQIMTFSAVLEHRYCMSRAVLTCCCPSIPLQASFGQGRLCMCRHHAGVSHGGLAAVQLLGLQVAQPQAAHLSRRHLGPLGPAPAQAA